MTRSSGGRGSAKSRSSSSTTPSTRSHPSTPKSANNNNQHQPASTPITSSPPLTAKDAIHNNPDHQPLQTPVAQKPDNLNEEEQKMYNMIETVENKIKFIASKLPLYTTRLTGHIALLCALRWRNLSPTSPTHSTEEIHSAHKTLQYSIGMIGESIMNEILKLDSVQTSNQTIRAYRKRTVVMANEYVALSDEMRKKMKKLERWLPSLEPKQDAQSSSDMELKSDDGSATPSTVSSSGSVSPAPSPVFAPMSASSDAASSASAAQNTQIKQQNNQHRNMDDEQQEHASITQTLQDLLKQAGTVKPKDKKKKKPAASAANQQPQQTARAAFNQPAPQTAHAATHTPSSSSSLPPAFAHYSHLNLPRYAGPSFRMSSTPRSLLLEGDMEGLQAKDVQVTNTNEGNVIVRGVRLPHRTLFGFDSSPYGYFEKTLNLQSYADKYNLSAMQAVWKEEEQALYIEIPLKPLARAPFNRNNYMVDDDVDEYSHPYYPSHPFSGYTRPPAPAAFSHYAPYHAQQPTPQPTRRNPFFGGFW